jgi:hypothetical protein
MEELQEDGEWTFLRDGEDRLREELDSVKESVDQLRKGKHIVIGRYSHTVSEDRFLNRYPATSR